MSQTAFHFACLEGHTKIVEMIIQKSVELNIKLNVGNCFGMTGFLLVETVRMRISTGQPSEALHAARLAQQLLLICN